jgi:hypothetical protein
MNKVIKPYAHYGSPALDKNSFPCELYSGFLQRWEAKVHRVDLAIYYPERIPPWTAKWAGRASCYNFDQMGFG